MSEDLLKFRTELIQEVMRRSNRILSKHFLTEERLNHYQQIGMERTIALLNHWHGDSR